MYVKQIEVAGVRTHSGNRSLSIVSPIPVSVSAAGVLSRHCVTREALFRIDRHLSVGIQSRTNMGRLWGPIPAPDSSKMSRQLRLQLRTSET